MEVDESKIEIELFSVPETNIKWRITNGGQLEAQWFEMMSYFEDNNKVKLTWRLEDTMETGEVEGTVGGVTIDNLQLGGHYSVILTDMENNLTESFNFTACK